MLWWHNILIYYKKRIMKTLKKIGAVVLTSLFLASCVPLKSNGNRGLPPGQVKKVTGAKSAKHYAPGHNK
jgi:hypothetical protein